MAASATGEKHTPTLAEQALGAIFDHLYRGDWGNAERVLNEYAFDVKAGRVDEEQSS
jgi:hypothetical protein